jgi:hypothetical protein
MLAIIKAALSALGIKDYLYAALAASILATGIYVVNHERAIGAAKVEKKDAALRAAETALNTASAQLADIKEIEIGRVYEKHISEPAVPNVGLVCHGPAVAAVQPNSSSDRPELNGPPTPRADDVFDPSGALLTDSRDADAQIAGLIATVLNLEAELEGVTK